jgi:hypothetical protein
MMAFSPGEGPMKRIDLPDTECALITSDDMEGLEFKIPNPEHQDLEHYRLSAASGPSERIGGAALGTERR